MKKFLAIVLALAFVFAFVACDETTNRKSNDTESDDGFIYFTF